MKAWLFAASVDGANASANLYTPVETAKANGHEPHNYIQHVLIKLPAAKSLEDIEAFLPFNLQSERCQAALNSLTKNKLFGHSPTLNRDKKRDYAADCATAKTIE